MADLALLCRFDMALIGSAPLLCNYSRSYFRSISFKAFNLFL